MDVLFLGFGPAVAGALVGWGLPEWQRRRRVRAAQVDTTEAQTKSDRELLETLYGAMITPEPTPLNPDPPPGLIERVTNLEKDRTFTGTISEGHLEGTVHTPAD